MKNKKDEIQEPIVEEISAETVGQQIILVEKAQSQIAPMANDELEGLKGTKVSLSNADDIRNAIKVSVIKAHISLKRSFEKVEIRFVIDQLKAEIIRSFPTIRLEEIQLSIHKGTMGEYGTVYNLSLATFVGFLRSYMNSNERVEAGKKYIKQLDFIEAISKPSDDEIRKAKVQISLNAFEKFKETGYYKDYGNYVFEALAGFGIINFTEEQKTEIFKQAISNVIRFYSQTPRSIDERNTNQRILAEIEKSKEHPFIYVEAKKIALNYFFTDLKEMGGDLKDLIES